MTSKVKDLTVGTPWKIILVFALPIALSYLLQQAYNLCDMWMIGQFLGEGAFASVGSTTPLNLFVLMFATGTATGFSVITAQRFGKKDLEQMKKSYISGTILCFILGIVLTILAALLCNPLLMAIDIGPGDPLYQDAFNYIMVIFLGIIANIFYNYYACILRAIGNNRAPLIFLIIAAVINIGLNALFLIPCKMGTLGAALGTVIAQLIAAITSFIYIQKNYSILKINYKEFKLTKEEASIHLKQGLPMGIQFSILYIALIILQRVVNNYDQEATAAFSAANKVDALLMQPMSAIGTAMVSFVGQNYGAKNFARIKKGIKQACIMQTILALLLSGLAFGIKDYIVLWLIKNPSEQTIEYGKITMTFIAMTQIFIGYIFLFRNSLQAAGFPYSAMMSSVSQATVRIIIATTFPLFMGFYGAALATPIAWGASALTLIIFTIIKIFKGFENVDYHLKKEKQ